MAIKRKAKRRDKWARPVGVEREYLAALRKVARIVGELITTGMPESGPYSALDKKGTMDAGPNDWSEWQRRIFSQLSAYEQALIPWAEQITKRLLTRIDGDARRAFASSSKDIFKGIRGIMAKEAAGVKMLELQAAQVHLIRSIPAQAAERAQTLAREIAQGGRRFEDIVKDIQASGDISEGRARVIARTETAKANATLTQARAQSIGSGGYYWRTMEDEAVRDSHQEMADLSDAGEIFSWDSPPEVEEGKFYHPGNWPNCRCYSEPLLPPLDET